MTEVDWRAAHGSLTVEVARVVALLRSGLDPTRPALGEWDLRGLATHLSQAWLGVPALATGERTDLLDVLPHLADRGEAAYIDDLADFPAFTLASTRADDGVDLLDLADRIERRAAAFLAWVDADTVQRDSPWLVSGIRVPMPTILCHLLNETVVHGWDLARAADVRPWPVDPVAAAMVVDGFAMAVTQRLPPRAMVDQDAAGGLRAHYELRVGRRGSRWVLGFDDGELTVTASTGQRVDCVLQVAPVPLLLLLWNRTTPWQALRGGGLLAWGRRPQLAARFPRLLRTP